MPISPLRRLLFVTAFCAPTTTVLHAQEGAPPSVAAPKLSAAEREVVRAVDARNGEALALLERIVNINSGTMNFAGVRRVGDALRVQLDSLGFATRWVDGAPFGRAGHLVA